METTYKIHKIGIIESLTAANRQIMKKTGFTIANWLTIIAMMGGLVGLWIKQSNDIAIVQTKQIELEKSFGEHKTDNKDDILELKVLIETWRIENQKDHKEIMDKLK